MISATERQHIDELQTCEDRSRLVTIAKESQNPFFLHEYAMSYNWDDGFDIADAVADNPNCDLGTALSLFWLAGAESLLASSAMKSEYNLEWVAFCGKIISRITSGYYRLGPVSFEPDLGRVQLYKLQKLGIDPVFYTAFTGVPVSHISGGPTSRGQHDA